MTTARRMLAWIEDQTYIVAWENENEKRKHVSPYGRMFREREILSVYI